MARRYGRKGGKRKHYAPKPKLKKEKYIGIFTGNRAGYGFVTVEGIDEDFFVPIPYVHTAMNGDTVEIQTMYREGSRRKDARVVSIKERATEHIVGEFLSLGRDGSGAVHSDDRRFSRDIFIPKDKTKKAVEGAKVVCKITDYGSNERGLTGKIVEILGHKNDPGTDILSVVVGMDIPTKFPKDVLKEAEDVAVPISKSERNRRRDLREVTMVTIDGEESKDLDDAVSLDEIEIDGEKGYLLGVHIADVSHYVREKSELDKEAKKRGTSVYLADRVIPMLPQVLSNGICSLNQGEDRLALSCLMTIDDKGNIVSHEIVESVICVDRRMTYTAVKKILVDKDKETKKEYRELVPLFKRMEKVSKKLRKNRHKKGAIDFSFTESKIEVDENGVPTEIKPYEISVANQLIEDFMLAANETVAKDFYERGVPFLYRTHGKPDEEKIRDLRRTLGKFGHTLKGKDGKVKPKDIQKMLESVAGLPEEGLLTMLTLRSMQRACYTVENKGHFGLAMDDYCHFTSPIRRYPDLQIHRIIKEVLCGSYDKKRKEHYASLLPAVAERTSALEKRAEDAERDVEKMKKAEFMEQHIGEVYDGTVSGVTGWGLYVALPNTVEGLISVHNLTDDYYYFSEETNELIGRRFNRRYALGQDVKIRVIAANKDERTVDFEMVERGYGRK